MKNSLFLIRHAESKFNVRARELWEMGLPPEESGYRWDSQFIDSELSTLGLEQVKQNRDHAQSLNVDTVLVSPLRRTLQTCEGLFSGHKRNPRIVVYPWITEICTSSCDISTYAGYPFQEFADYDWRFIQQFKFYWLIEMINNRFSQEVYSISNDPKEAKFQLCKKMESIFPFGLETHEQAILRVEKAKQDCRDLLKSGNVALVGHHVFFQRFTEGVGRRYITLANCEILKFNLEDT
jgi:broad specificity phosphatase PhoE